MAAGGVAKPERSVMVSTLPFSRMPNVDFMRGLAGWAEGIEIMAEGPAWQDLESAGQEVGRLLQGYRGPVTLHAPTAGLDLARVEDAELREFSLRVYRRSVRLAAELRVSHVVIHTHLWHRPIENRREAKRLAVEALFRLGQEAQGLNLKVAFENVGFGPSALFTAEEFVELFRQPLPGICPLLDVGHAHLNGWDVPSVLRLLGSTLEAVHLHDNHGERDEHAPVGLGTVPWPAVWAALRGVPQPLKLILEYRSGVDAAQLAEHQALIRAVFSESSPATRPIGKGALPMAADQEA